MTGRSLAAALLLAGALVLPPLLWRAALAASVTRELVRLGSAEADTRASASARLRRLQPHAVPLAIAAFGAAADAWDPGRLPPGVEPGGALLTIPIMTWLRDTGGPDVVAALVDALADDDGHVRHSAALTLAWLGEQAVPALVQVLQHATDTRQRVSAAWVVSFLGPSGSAALPALRAALDDPDKDLRYTARYAIAEIGAVDDVRARVIDSATRRDEER